MDPDVRDSASAGIPEPVTAAVRVGSEAPQLLRQGILPLHLQLPLSLPGGYPSLR